MINKEEITFRSITYGLHKQDNLSWEAKLDMARKCDEHNANAVAKRQAMLTQFLELGNALFSGHSNVIKYLKNNAYKGYTCPYSSCVDILENQRRRDEEEKAKKDMVARELESSLELARKAERAKIYIKSRQPNYELTGQEYDGTLVDIANNFVVQDKIKAAVDAGNVYVDDHICECESWDGESHRCNCGNRRMHWESDGIDFEHPDQGYVYSQAH